MNNSQLPFWDRLISSAYRDDEWNAGRLNPGKQSMGEGAEQTLTLTYRTLAILRRVSEWCA